MSSSKCALVFPGQGAQQADMLDGVRGHQAFAPRYRLVCDVLDNAPLDLLAAGDQQILEQNAVSSLLTVLASSLSWDIYHTAGEPAPKMLAGYSVGQWTALYAAGSLDFESLVRLVKVRADLMDQCIARSPSAMLGVIGLDEKVVESVCREVREAGHFVAISNYNASGQFSVGGGHEAIRLVKEQLEARQAKRVVPLPVAGAWHSQLLDPAADEFASYLETVQLQPPRLPVADNVTGGLLPDDVGQLRQRMARHVASPVRWQQCVETLIGLGATEFVEIGFGMLLTKFGFFIDRSVEHRAFYTAEASPRIS